MRWFSVLSQDVRYQIKYGFYFLYAFISGIYIVILHLVPASARPEVATLIILSDPAMLGFFFIGGIWLLEKGEGLHQYWSVLPVKPFWYITAKMTSLALISTLSGLLIARWSGLSNINYPCLGAVLLVGSSIFTLLGLTLATGARTVNHYLVVTIPAELGLLLPPLILLCGLDHSLLYFFPGTQLWAAIRWALGLTKVLPWSLIIGGLLFWLTIVFAWASRRVPLALREGGCGQ